MPLGMAAAPSLAQPAHDGGATEPVEARPLAVWEAGTFLESIAVAPDGTAYVVNHGAHAVDRVQNGRIEPFARTPGEVTGILLRGEGGMLASGRMEDGLEVVFQIGSDGEVAVLAELPGAGFLNGMTWLDEGRVLIADSDAGVLWSVETATGRVSEWARDPLLDHADPGAHFPENTGFPAANGVKLFGGAVYVSNSGRGAILRIPLMADGTSGKPEVWAADIVADDFVFDAGGNAYVPTHPMQSVVRLGSDGSRTTLATPAQGLAGPTAVTIAPDGGLYVVGNSGIPIDGTLRPAALLRLDIGGTQAASLRRIVPPTYMMVTAPTIPGSDARRAEHGPAYLRFLEDHFDRIALGGQVRGEVGRG